MTAPLYAEIDLNRLPRHVAIIMDGNGRWAKQHKVKVALGHRTGTETLREIIRSSSDIGIEALSLYAFSTENWARPAAEVEALMNDPACVTLYGRLLDKFGDNGIVTALIGRQTGDALDIELWIMSCRTFKRNLEYALFDRLVDVCRERGIKTINGIYLPTAKNLLVADFYATIGFEKISGGETGSVFRYTVPAERTPLNTVMETVLL